MYRENHTVCLKKRTHTTNLFLVERDFIQFSIDYVESFQIVLEPDA